ncbi:hypothetical protein BDB00DRAFT_765733, partial [Zychaea mexicana]|uniref:uncharacterized protein n=1 Tax=Zychaea mexicana TaxID=64656 RepID=UPI0022FE02B7
SVEQFDDWRHDNSESETTVYRRFVVLLDKLLRNTSIMLQDGENASNATKDAMILLQSLTSSITTTNERTEMSMYGRKIDLLAITKSREQNVELTSSEWKREGVSESISLKQQCKSIRTNAAILSKLMLIGDLGHLVAMDWLGKYKSISSFKLSW